MNNNILIGVVVVIIVAIAGFYYFSQKQYQPASPQTTNQLSTTKQSVEGNAVIIQNFSFNPGTLTVKSGTKVTWTNKDSTTHRIKSDTFNSSDLNQGDTFEVTFKNKGSFNYSCAIHPYMTGTIVVD